MPENIEYLSLNETNALLNLVGDTRDRAIVILFLNSGLFLNELTNLKIDSVDLEKKLLSVTGSRKREIPLNAQVLEAVSEWKKEKPQSKSSALFVTTKGQPKDLSARTVDHLIRKYGEQSGIKRKVNAQILRNAFAIKLFQEEPDQKKAATILGITDPDSIKRYAQAAKQPISEPEATKPTEAKPVEKQSFFKRLFSANPQAVKHVTEIKGPIYTNPEEIIIGRDTIIEETKINLKRNQSILLIGPLGIGKTHLLKHFVKLLSPNTVYISSPSPIKSLLAQMGDKFNPDWKKEIKTRASTKEILDFIIKTKPAHPPVIIIDNLNNLRASDVETFVAILENFTILGSTEEIKPKLKQIWWKFKQIELNPLDKDSTKELIKYLTQNLSIADYEMLETRILNLSNGLPLAIVDMIHQLSHKPHVSREAIREVYHEAGIKYRDWTYVIVILWAIAIMSRFIALGTHSFEGYILAGFGVAIIGVVRFMLFKMR